LHHTYSKTSMTFHTMFDITNVNIENIFNIVDFYTNNLQQDVNDLHINMQEMLLNNHYDEETFNNYLSELNERSYVLMKKDSLKLLLIDKLR
jgi:hypothetical protein